jgi:hypothetical protein
MVYATSRLSNQLVTHAALQLPRFPPRMEFVPWRFHAFHVIPRILRLLPTPEPHPSTQLHPRVCLDPTRSSTAADSDNTVLSFLLLWRAALRIEQGFADTDIPPPGIHPGRQEPFWRASFSFLGGFFQGPPAPSIGFRS